MNNGNGLRGIEYLIALNKHHSEVFSRPGMKLTRQQYRYMHPTEISVDKCMDGRLNLPVITNTALGIIQPMRNVAGKFDLGWLGYQTLMEQWVQYAISRGRDCLKIITYHFDRMEPHRGCRGFDYDVDKAKAFTAGLKRQYDEAFGKEVLYTIQLGIDTYWDALILHGANGEEVDLALLPDTSTDYLKRLIDSLYPDMPSRIRQDLLPLLTGNVKHIAEVKAANRPVDDVEHREWVIAVGRGFDWLHENNTAFIIGPFNPNLSEPILTAANIMLGNLKAGNLEGKDIVLMASAPYYPGNATEKVLAKLKAKFLADFAWQQIQQHVPELAAVMKRLTVTVDMGTRAMDVLDRS